jgi:plasmid stability protein
MSVANITVKNIPEDLYERLKRAARLRHRSINGEIIACIERSLRSERIPAATILAQAEEIRGLTRGGPMTLEELDRARREGRP